MEIFGFFHFRIVRFFKFNFIGRVCLRFDLFSLRKFFQGFAKCFSFSLDFFLEIFVEVFFFFFFFFFFFGRTIIRRFLGGHVWRRGVNRRRLWDEWANIGFVGRICYCFGWSSGRTRELFWTQIET